jgi:hypothetical protein
MEAGDAGGQYASQGPSTEDSRGVLVGLRLGLQEKGGQHDDAPQDTSSLRLLPLSRPSPSTPHPAVPPSPYAGSAPSRRALRSLDPPGTTRPADWKCALARRTISSSILLIRSAIVPDMVGGAVVLSAGGRWERRGEAKWSTTRRTERVFFDEMQCVQILERGGGEWEEGIGSMQCVDGSEGERVRLALDRV